ncbi:MAG: type II toxin-antitoxin system HicA family toxin [Phormidesmis sp. CAN_BIN44]|nr:type II toxin-antitoxin system HicA family toxin [Phormidesmis sp. CAN_BIN44]
MPRKIRDYKIELIALGFTERKGKGSHHNWKHLQLQSIITIAFKNGDDVPLYLEKQLRKAKLELESEQ